MGFSTELAKTLVSPSLAQYYRRKLAKERQNIVRARSIFFSIARGTVSPDSLAPEDRALIEQFFDGYDRNFKDPVVGEELSIAQSLVSRINNGQLRPEALNPAQRAIVNRYEEIVLHGRSRQMMRDRSDDDAGLAQRPDDSYQAPDDGDRRTVQGLGNVYNLRGLGEGEDTPAGAQSAAIDLDSPVWQTISVLGWVLSVVGVGAGAYHGYKRNNSVGWAIGWGLLGGLFPVITLGIAAGQGFGKKA